MIAAAEAEAVKNNRPMAIVILDRTGHIYYREGRVPQPGIIILGQVTDDVSIFDRPGSVTVRVEWMK